MGSGKGQGVGGGPGCLWGEGVGGRTVKINERIKRFADLAISEMTLRSSNGAKKMLDTAPVNGHHYTRLGA